MSFDKPSIHYSTPQNDFSARIFKSKLQSSFVTWYFQLSEYYRAVIKQIGDRYPLFYNKIWITLSPSNFTVIYLPKPSGRIDGFADQLNLSYSENVEREFFIGTSKRRLRNNLPFICLGNYISQKILLYPIGILL